MILIIIILLLFAISYILSGRNSYQRIKRLKHLIYAALGVAALIFFMRIMHPILAVFGSTLLGSAPYIYSLYKQYMSDKKSKFVQSDDQSIDSITTREAMDILNLSEFPNISELDLAYNIALKENNFNKGGSKFVEKQIKASYKKLKQEIG